ncbi:YbaB/EbfC family nucleoid-associated protein [Nocardia flavorosea]|uniref:YbaB/EbfC family nucleoid-associated protein n=1 Tax=Nocardia flavorosea TaxID=53429 RepID=A0A846YFW8_9NOCA|nr:YbaB/EbfC family nucleoid-associated protein [Nocardia flavorosea]NKY55729.1 YbaB/EbfC family nucleoid-associated protein [Nocardia flavorosea]
MTQPSPGRSGDEVGQQLRMEVHRAMDAYEDQIARLAEIRGHLDTVRIQARSVDGQVEVSVDSAGVVVEIELQQPAMREKPDALARKIAEVAREAARYAEKYRVEALGPITEIVGAMPDLPELVPGAPSLRDPFPPEVPEESSP